MVWLRVHYPSQRTVLLDGEDLGDTNTLLYAGVDGTYTVSLAGDRDFDPDSVTAYIANTTREAPFEVTFAPKGA